MCAKGVAISADLAIRAMERLSVEGIDSVLQAAEERQSGTGGVFVLFCGSVQPESDESWCSDCVKGRPAEPAAYAHACAKLLHAYAHTLVRETNNSIVVFYS